MAARGAASRGTLRLKERGEPEPARLSAFARLIIHADRYTFRLRRATPMRPTRPVANNIIAAGSGAVETADAPPVAELCANPAHFAVTRSEVCAKPARGEQCGGKQERVRAPHSDER
jgi:hypothetical protein